MEPHYEKNLIINNRELKYKGIFRVDELFHVINKALEEKGYQKREKRTEELVTEEGRRTFLELRPFKEVTNYITLMIKLRITLDHVTETVEMVKGEKRKFEQGDVEIIFDGWILTDYESRWGMKPFVYFMKAMVNKYLYKMPLEGKIPGTLTGDTAYVYAQVKKLLQSYKYESGKIVREEDVIKAMQKEMEKGEE